MGMLLTCMSVYYMHHWYRGSQERVSDHLKLELKTVVTWCGDARNQTRSSGSIPHAPNC